MSSTTARKRVATPTERAALRPDLDTSGKIQSKQAQPENTTPVRRFPLEALGLAAAAVAAVVMFVLFLVHPVEHEPLDVFLTTVFGRGNAAIWPMQLVWYASAVAMVGLALWPVHRSTQIISLLAAAYLTWIGIVFFGVVDSGGVGLAWLWAIVFILEAILFLNAGLVRRDLGFAPRFDHWDLATVLGAIFIGYALVGYPIMGLLSGHPLSTLPVFGLAPCVTVVFFFGLLLWARPPVPLYLLPLLLAWALNAAPGNLAMGHAADFVLIPVAVITAIVILWRDRRSTWQTVVSGLLLALMIVFSGLDDLLIGTALVLVAVTLTQAVRDSPQRTRPGPLLPAKQAPNRPPSRSQW
jgi:hypothetical protein